MSKAALNVLTRKLALELHQNRTTVVAVNLATAAVVAAAEASVTPLELAPALLITGMG